MLRALYYRRFSCSLLVAGLAFVRSASSAAESFDAIQSRAHDMGETSAGKAYEKQFGTAFGPSMRDSLEACTKSTKPPYIVNFVFVIATDGTVRRIIPAPQQPVSACVAEKLGAIHLPPPPKNDWLVAVNITIQE
jgi:hypothetical protein